MEKRFEKDFIEKIITESRRKLWIVNCWDHEDSEIFLYHNYENAKNKYDELFANFKNRYFHSDPRMKSAIERNLVNIVDQTDRQEMHYYHYEDAEHIILYSTNVNN